MVVVITIEHLLGDHSLALVELCVRALHLALVVIGDIIVR